MTRLLLLLALLPAAALAQEPATLLQDARDAYTEGDYAACGALYARALDRMAPNENAAYNAACCFALAGDPDAAFAYLRRSLDAGWRDTDHLQADGDLDALHDDARWAAAVAAAEANEAAYVASINGELYEMYTNDQAERRAAMDGEVEWRVVAENDERRRARVYAMMEAGALEAADDYFHAAMVLQHGRDSTDYRHARDLAVRATELDAGHRTARWLSAAATDRYLWSLGEPQIYGTQSQTDEDGLWTMEPIDEDAVTDAERAAKGVPPLDRAYDRLEQRNAERRAEMEASGAEGGETEGEEDGQRPE